MKEQISREGRSDRERCCFDSRYYEHYDHKSVKSSASAKGCKLLEYYNSPTSFLSSFSARSSSMPRFDGKSTSFNSFIRNFETHILKRKDCTLRIHYLISACERKLVEHCVLLDLEQGYTEALRILETLYWNPGKISDVPVGRKTKGIHSRKKLLPLPCLSSPPT